ncbi:MAG: T9SS type A sorting domain-containing protein [Bacteroidetes bacterium]|nr:T9SS type A sorting domain-containing protein [Bacteroidota bacterium]
MKKLLSVVILIFACSLAFSQITLTSTVTNATCFGGATGSATIIPTGGNAPYTYSITAPPQSNGTGIFSSLLAGTYSVMVSDAMAATNSITFTITEPSQILLNVTSTPALCNGTSTGTINITSVIGGNPAFTYNLNGSAYQGSSAFLNVPAGILLVGVRDINGCIGSNTVQVTEPTQLNSITNVNHVKCFGTSTGTVTASGIGGTAPYSYLWPTLASTMATVPNVAIGTYTVIVTDANGCVTGNNITVLQPTQLIATTTVTNANCGQADGSICASVTGGAGGPYTFLWSNSSTAQCLSLVPAGNYSVTVTDPNLCTYLHVGTVNNIGGPIISISSQTNVTCFGLCNGIATTSLSGGTGPFIYTWSNGQVTPIATNLCAGIYTVNVTDAIGCIGTTSISLTQPTALNVFVNPNNPSCFGSCNGSAVAAAFGGTPPYSYNWTGGGGNTPTTNPLCAGNYGVTITDNNGCIATSSVAILNPPPLTAIITKTDVTCGGNCDGQAFANVSGGSGAFTFLWLPTLQTGNTANGLCAGQCSLNVTDQNGCVTTETFVIANQGISTITNATLTTTVINETCLFTNDGGIDLTISGTNPGPFTYQWSNGATTQDITNIPTGSYNVTVFDASLNCLSISSNVNATGTNCGTISGNVFIDNNSDCIKNAGDNNSSNIQIIANPGNRIGYTNWAGDYVFNNIPFATYTITSLTNANMIATCTTTLNTTLNSGNTNSMNNNFVKQYIPVTQPDLFVSAYSNGIVPGFVCYVNYYLSNLNNISATGLFKAVLPSAFISTITTGNPNTYTISGDTIIWNFNNITNATGSNYFTINFTTPLTNPLGSIFTTCMWAQPTVTDLNYVNNTTCYQRMVTGSFDPNDKTVSPVGIGANGDIAATETDLTYLIRFQNTGNGPAVNIYVKDTLSPNVDINTFEMLSASHNYMIDVLPGNVLRWKFNNIMLPDSNSNEPASHGYIQYRIKRTNNNTPGTQIKNTAYIYFDFNEPVVTNTAINTIETITGIKSSSSNNDEWNVYPNPSTGILYIANSSSVKEESQIQVINSIGQTVLEETITNNYKNIDLSKLNNGVYFVKIVSDKQSVIKRVVLSR